VRAGYWAAVTVSAQARLPVPSSIATQWRAGVSSSPAGAGLSAGDGMLSAHLATVQSQAHLMLSDHNTAATATRALDLADQVAAVTAVDAVRIQ
jgi:hypothetical protein